MQLLLDNIIALFNNSSLAINNLKLAGIILEWLALECLVPDLTHLHVCLFCNNTSAVSWVTKLRTSTSRAASRLLRFLGMQMHTRHTSVLSPLSICGDQNLMADIVS